MLSSYRDSGVGCPGTQVCNKSSGPALVRVQVPVFSSAGARKAPETHWVLGLNDENVYCVVCPAANPYPQVRHPKSRLWVGEG